MEGQVLAPHSQCTNSGQPFWHLPRSTLVNLARPDSFRVWHGNSSMGRRIAKHDSTTPPREALGSISAEIPTSSWQGNAAQAVHHHEDIVQPNRNSTQSSSAWGRQTARENLPRSLGHIQLQSDPAPQFTACSSTALHNQQGTKPSLVQAEAETLLPSASSNDEQVLSTTALRTFFQQRSQRSQSSISCQNWDIGMSRDRLLQGYLVLSLPSGGSLSVTS